MSLALSTLIYEWRRYLAAIISLAAAGLIVLSMVGLFMGIGQAFNAPITKSPADIMVLSPKATALFSGGAGLPRRVIPQIYMHPGVSEVMDLEGSGGLWQNDPNSATSKRKGPSAQAQRTFVQSFAVDTSEGSVTLPTDFGPDVRAALDEPYAIAIDETARGTLGVELGDKASLNGHTVKVRYLLHGYANIANAMVFMSRQTARLLGIGNSGPRVGPLMVKLKNPADALKIRDELNASPNAQNSYRAWTREELAQANQQQLLKNNIIGIMLIGGLIIGGFVGMVITWQTLRGAIFANIKEFASLRALGVSMGSLRWVIMELSFWVGVAGLLVTALLIWGTTVLAGFGGLPMAYPIQWVVTVAVLLLIVAVVAGFLSLGILKKSQPADLLR
ncbi:MAG: ABC transporter permease [Proteobacteria bacterium]|nr:ABC transporter permease [Pseudomonadota bacterium]